jgi:biopolymer transport protein ExbB
MTQSVNHLADILGNACYGFLAANFFWGLFCVILLWRRLTSLRFVDETSQLQFLGELDSQLDSGNFEAAADMCRSDPRALPQLALGVIENRELNQDQRKQLVGDLMDRNIFSDLEFRVSWVATVIKSGPLLGLFGTVLGMMAAFGRIGTGDKIKTETIAMDISIALICTAMGLMTAIPFTYLLANLNVRVRKLQDSLTSGMTRFLDHFQYVATRFPHRGNSEPSAVDAVARPRPVPA